MSGIFTDIRHGARRLRRAPVFAATVVLTMGVGIAAFVSIYGVVDNVLLERMPYRDPSRLVYLWRDYPWMSFPRGWMGGVDVLALRESADVFEGIAVMRSGAFNLTADGSDPSEAQVMLTSANFFDILGVEPRLGRSFVEGEDEEGAPPVAVLGHSIWQQRYGGDAAIIGRTIRLDGKAVQVVGVMPEWFDFAMHSSLGSPRTAELYVPLTMDLSQVTGGSLAALGRLREGVSPELLRAQLDAAIEPIDREYFNDLGLRVWAVGLREDLLEGVRPTLLAIFGAATFMLLILAVNLATLLLARAARRGHEAAVRAALGADRSALLQDSLAESLLLSVAGAAAGLVLATWGTSLIVSLLPEDFPRRATIGIDMSIAATAIGVAMAIGIGAAGVSARRTLGGNVADVLRAAGGRSTGGGAPKALVVAQVALSVILLAGSGVLGKSLLHLLRANPGFDPRGVLTLRVPLAEQQYRDDTDAAAFFRRARARLAQLPGVTAVGGVSALPLTEETSQTDASFPDSVANTGDTDVDQPLIDHFSATPGYFETLRIPVRAGRGFAAGDDANAPPVAVIDDTLARRFFPDGNAIGRSMHVDEDPFTIVGVVDQPRLYRVREDDRGQVFFAAAQVVRSSLFFALRSDRDPAALAAEARSAIQELDANQPVSMIRSMEHIAAQSMTSERLSLEVIGGFSCGALLLAVIGLYGVVANTVTRRTREIGVRMALGADARLVRTMVIGQGMRLVAAGIVAGIAGALVTTRFLESLLFGVRPTDPATLISVALVLVLGSLLACYFPARRATRIDPQVALRAE